MAAILSTVITGAINLISEGLDFFQGDKKTQAELVLEQLKAAKELNLAQLEINAKEAQHQSIFVAGWRPFIGWVCGAALFFAYIIRPYVFPFLYESFPELRDLPVVDEVLWELMFGLLGMAGLRSLDKRKK